MANEPQAKPAEVELACGDYSVAAMPRLGGSLARFSWRGEPLMREICGPSVLDTACFPLVPFSNRIAHGRFSAGGRQVRLLPNFPGSDHPHPLHGFGWLAAWTVSSAEPARAVLHHRHEADDWPWTYEAEQELALDDAGLVHSLRVRNLGDEPMPAGLGFHPYFPRTEQTLYHGLHRGEWQTTEDCLPLRLDERAAAIDWWAGKPVGAKAVDTVYTGREGPLTITWPERQMRLRIEPSANLPFTVVYSPARTDHFCVEAVSHPTDAINRPETGPMRWLERDETFAMQVRYRAEPL